VSFDDWLCREPVEEVCPDCSAHVRAVEVPVDCEDCGGRFACGHDGVTVCLDCRPSDEMPGEADDYYDHEEIEVEVMW
jgi:predicted nucleic acid binding AN1-type Zn finger protein